MFCDDLAGKVLDGRKGEVHVLELRGAGGHCHTQEVDALWRGGHQVDVAIFVEATKEDLVDGVVIILEGWYEWNVIAETEVTMAARTTHVCVIIINE